MFQRLLARKVLIFSAMLLKTLCVYTDFNRDVFSSAVVNCMKLTRSTDLLSFTDWARRIHLEADAAEAGVSFWLEKI
jgi:hypothetical protein